MKLGKKNTLISAYTAVIVLAAGLVAYDILTPPTAVSNDARLGLVANPRPQPVENDSTAESTTVLTASIKRADAASGVVR
jgi:hypothetical protein